MPVAESMEPRLFIELLRPDGSIAAAVAPPSVAEGTSEAGRFRLAWQVTSVDGAGLAELRVTVTHMASEPSDCGVRIGLDRPASPEPPSWLIPGLFYGENRPPGCRRRFPRYERDAHDGPGMVSESWSFRSDRAATPAVFAREALGTMVVAVDEVTGLGPSGIGLEGSAERTRIWVDLPYREEPVTYRGYDAPDAPTVRTRRWEAGDGASFVVLLGPDVAGPTAILRWLWARPGPPAVEPWVDVEEAAGLAADGLVDFHYHEEHRALYETAAFERELDGSAGGSGDRPHMHVGWVSGAPWAAQLLAWGRRIGSERHAAAGIAVLDNIAEHLAPSGTFWAEWTLEGGWGTGWSPRGTIHANTIGQATLFFLRALEGEDAAGVAHPGWESAVRSNLDAVASRQAADGNFGTYHDARTGIVTEWDGAGPLVWVAALLAGADRFGDDRYREAAERAGRHYRRFVDAELIYGAPEDIHLAPSSEDGYNAVIAYVALHRCTGDPEWLDVARRAADWMLTFRYTYDVAFEPDTLLGHYGFRTRGTDQASPANQHLHHFGLMCVPELVQLSRATGDDHYRQRAVESLAAWRQFVARRDGDFNAMRGMVSERFYQTDCFRAKGSLLPLSHAWTGGVLLLACLAALEDPNALSA